jgi:hypothetical protein
MTDSTNPTNDYSRNSFIKRYVDDMGPVINGYDFFLSHAKRQGEEDPEALANELASAEGLGWYLDLRFLWIPPNTEAACWECQMLDQDGHQLSFIVLWQAEYVPLTNLLMVQDDRRIIQAYLIRDYFNNPEVESI